MVEALAFPEGQEAADLARQYSTQKGEKVIEIRLQQKYAISQDHRKILSVACGEQGRESQLMAKISPSLFAASSAIHGPVSALWLV